MMRDFKFRAWDGHEMDYELEEAVVQESGVNFIIRYMQESLGYILMQFTGLLDKQNKEIYEGDIIQYSGEYFRETASVVWYKTGSWGLHGREKSLNELIFSEVLGYDSISGKPFYTEVEVIGNIYESQWRIL